MWKELKWPIRGIRNKKKINKNFKKILFFPGFQNRIKKC